MSLYTDFELPTISERILPYATVYKVILDEGTSATTVNQVGASAIAGSGFNPPVPGSQPSPLEIECTIYVTDLLCTGVKSLMLNDKFRQHIKIHLVETIDGLSSETVFGIDPAFDLSQMVSQGNNYVITHKTQYPFLRPQSLEYRAWVELDLNSLILDFLSQGTNLTNVSETGIYTSAKSIQEIIVNGNIRQYTTYDYQTSENAGHKHVYLDNTAQTKQVCSPPDADGNVICHQHAVIQEEVQEAIGAQGPHVHYLIPMTQIVDLRDLSRASSPPTQVGGGVISSMGHLPAGTTMTLGGGPTQTSTGQIPAGTTMSYAGMSQPTNAPSGQQVNRQSSQTSNRSRGLQVSQQSNNQSQGLQVTLQPRTRTSGLQVTLNPPAPLPLNLFSDFYSARDLDGSNRFFFGIDMKKILSEHSVFGNFYERPSSYRHIMEQSPPPISSIRIYRRRIPGSGESELSPLNLEGSVVYGDSRENNFMDNEVSELIVQADQRFSDSTIRPTRLNNGSSVEEVVIEAQNDVGVRYFSGIDKSITQKTDGFYKYHIEVDIQDTVYRVINFHANTLSQDINTLKEYYSSAQNSAAAIKNPFGAAHLTSTGDYVKPRVQKGFQSPELEGNCSTQNNMPNVAKKENVPASSDKNSMYSKGFEKGEYVPRSFNALTNKFSQSFRQNLRWSNPSSGDGVSDELVAILDRFVTIDNFYSPNPLSDLEFDRRIRSLMNIISPVGGSPEGISSVIAVMEKVNSDINSIIDLYQKPDDKNSGTTNATTRKSHVEGGDRKKMTIISVSNEFSYICNASDMGDIGIDFMALGTDENFGLKKVSRDMFRKITSREVSKLFDSETANVGIEGYDEQDTVATSMMSYFTPTKIGINPSIDLTIANSNQASVSNKEEYKKVASATFFYNAGRKSKSKSASYQSYVVKKQDSSKKEPPYSNPNQPLNSKEQEMVAQKINLKSEIENANTSAQWISDNLGVQIVNKEESSPNTSPTSTADATMETADSSDKTKNYIENDLGKGSTSQNNRAASPILKQLINQDSGKSPNQVKDYNLIDGNSKVKQNFDKIKKTINPNDSLRELPNPVKLLIKSNSRSYPPDKSGDVRKEVEAMLSEDVNSDNVDMFRYKFYEIVEVQILREYKKSANGYSLMLPKWEKLTQKAYDEYAGKNLLCRIIPYENKIMGIERAENYDLPTYDEYFILEGS